MKAVKEDIKRIAEADLGSWPAIFASLLPLWLFSLVISAEGFPRFPLSLAWTLTALIFVLVVSVVLLWKGWLILELLLYSIFPFFILLPYDEISTCKRR